MNIFNLCFKKYFKTESEKNWLWNNVLKKCCFRMKYIVKKKIQWPNTFCTSLYIMSFYCGFLFARMSTQYINLLIVYFPCRSSDDINMFSVRLPLYFCLSIQGNRYSIDTGNIKNQNEGLCLKRKVWRY